MVDQQSDGVFSWVDNPFEIGELEAAIDSSCKNSAPGLDRIDYAIIRFFPLTTRLALLRIFNEMFEQGLFHYDWRTSLIVFVPKLSNEGFRPIALSSCLLKIFEKMVYRRMQWVAESQFMLPESQAGFRSFRSCADNLTILTNHVHLAFMNRAPLLALFLDIAGAFDNVIPNILVQDLRMLGFPARTCKFIENLLCERYIRFVVNGDLSEPRIVHKGTPQGSILSPLLFNIYLRELYQHLHPDTHLLQYADDIVLYSWNSEVSLLYESTSSSLSHIYEYLKYRGLDLSPAKSKIVIFNRRSGPPLNPGSISVNNIEIPQVSSVRFLGIILDSRLNGKKHLNFLIKKGNCVANIITSLTGTRWGAHPYLLLSLYRSIFRGSIEYGAQIFNLNKNRSLLYKLYRQQYRIIRAALGLRQSTPINILFCESREPPLNLRFTYLTSKFILKNLARKSNLVIRSLYMLKMEARTQFAKNYLIKNVPVFKPFMMQVCEKDRVFRSVLPSSLGYDFLATIPVPQYLSFDLPSNKTRKRDHPCSVAEVRQRFEEFASPITNQAISLYTDGSKEDHGLPVGAAVLSYDLGIVLKHKLPADTSIFSAEAWALYQSLIMIESAENRKAVIFSDAKSVLDAVSSSGKKYDNYLIPLIKLKYHLLSAAGFSIQFVWIPSHVGIVGNESADAVAKRAARNGHKPKFKIPHTDLFFPTKRRMEIQFCSLLEEAFRQKGILYFFHFYHLSPKSWFYKYKLSREQIVTINRIRSNHYNLNYSLYRKNIVASAACPCGDSRQDINHVIFYCRLTRNKAKCLLSFLFPANFLNIFPYINSPPHKLCRLLLAFLRSVNLYI